MSGLPDWARAYAGQRVFVTGDTGFKGSWLALFLRHLGAEVHGYALPPERAIDNYVRCDVASQITHTDGDLRDVPALRAAVEAAQPAFVFHLAAQPLVIASYERPAETFEVNVQGTVNVLDAIRATPGVRAAVMITTDKCYENREWLWPYREDDRLGGADPYSASKAAAELVVASYRRSFFAAPDAARIATARAGNVIGAGDWADNRIVPDCVRALQAGDAVTVRNPAAIRPWQHVLDPLAGYLQLGARLLSDASAASAWNFGPDSDRQYSVGELVAEAIAAWGSGTVHTPPRPPDAVHEAHRLALDSTKARLTLGWAPRLPFTAAVRATIAGYQAEDAAPHEVRADRLRHIERLLAAAAAADAADTRSP